MREPTGGAPDPAAAAAGGRDTTTRLVAVEGAFDLAAALRLAAEARAQPAAASVTIDLRRARIEDVALAAFVHGVMDRPIAIVGLSRHHERLLRYLEGSGADVGSSAQQ